MLRIFRINPQTSKLSIKGEHTPYGLNIAASPHRENGSPCGLVATHGMVYNTLPEDLPVCLVTQGGLAIRQTCSVDQIATADYVFSGMCMLVWDYALDAATSPLNVKPLLKIPRIGLGILDDGQVVVLYDVCTLEKIQNAFMALNAHSAVLLAQGETLFSIGENTINPSTVPSVTLMITDYSELPRPFIVIDPGHGGSDVGGRSLIEPEKTINLKNSLLIKKELDEKYRGTFLLTRDKDVFVHLQTRCDYANAIDADLFFSYHCNAFDGTANGFETFVYYRASVKSREVQSVVHEMAMDYLGRFGVTDRKRKTSGFLVLKHTKMPAVLIETLFMDNKKDVAFLSNESLMNELNSVYVAALARSMELKPKLAIDIPHIIHYNVCVGSFTIQANADKLIAELQSHGYTPYILKKE